jgi:hypothetical protein
MDERRHDAGELRYGVDGLTVAVADLKLTVAELKMTVAQVLIRDVEDRGAAAKFDTRISALERWRARISGQIALLYLLTGGVVSLVGARILHFT